MIFYLTINMFTINMSTISTFDVEILLSRYTTWQEKLDAAAHIINTYNLSLTQKKIMTAFSRVRLTIYGSNQPLPLRQGKFLFNTLLNNNKNMFTAVIRAFNNGDFDYYDFTYLIVYTGPNYDTGYNVGFTRFANPKDAGLILYSKLLDCNDFDIDDLDINQKYKLLIQQYRNKKYGGKLTKAAIAD